MHVYYSALPFTPKNSVLYRVHSGRLAEHSPSVLRGTPADWTACLMTLAPSQGTGPLVVAFSPDGQYIIAGYSNSSMLKFDTATGAAIGEPLLGHSGAVTSFSFSTKSSRFVSGSIDKTLRLWDPSAGSVIGEPFQGHTGRVNAVAFSPDGRRIISGSDDQTILLWDAATGTLLGDPLRGHTGRVLCVVFCPDGEYVLSGGADGTVRLWDRATTTSPQEIFQYLVGSEVTTAEFSPSDNMALIAAWSGAHLWDQGSRTLQGPLLPRESAVMSVARSPDESCVAAALFNGTIRLWHDNTEQLETTLLHGHTSTVLSVAFSPNGNYLLSCSEDNTIRLWDWKGTTVKKDDEIWSIAFSNDGSKIVTGNRNGVLHLWDGFTGALIAESPRLHKYLIRAVAFSPDGLYIASGAQWDKEVRLWDGGSCQPLGDSLIGHTHSAPSLAFSRDSKTIKSTTYGDTTGIEGQEVLYWDIQSHQRIAIPQSFEQAPRISTALVRDYNSGWWRYETPTERRRLWWVHPAERGLFSDSTLDGQLACGTSDHECLIVDGRKFLIWLRFNFPYEAM
jgi:WD40 repeat protein